MAYRLKPTRGIESEVRRIAGTQLRLAIAEMRGANGAAADKTVHEARRHVKKVRALIRLVQLGLGAVYRPVNAHLRAVTRMLAPIADGEAVIGTLDRLGAKYRRQLSRAALASIRTGLTHRQARVVRKAAADRVLASAARMLETELERVHRWQLRDGGFRAIAPGLERTIRAARRAMQRAIAHPSNNRYLPWRRRVKDQWFQIRLLEGRTGGALVGWERRLEALDGVLGEHHNCALLEDALASWSFVSRNETADCLRLIRRYRTELRREALALGADLYREKPKRMVREVRRHWHPVIRTPRPATTQNLVASAGVT